MRSGRMPAQGVYRRLSVRMWGDERFMRLSPLPASGQSLWVYILSGPHTTPIPGLFVCGRAAMAESLRWSSDAFEKAFAEVLEQSLVEFDARTRVWFIPNALKHNMPANPNVVLSWRVHWVTLPEFEGRDVVAQRLRSELAAVSSAFAEAFDEVVGVNAGHLAAEKVSKASAKPCEKPFEQTFSRPSAKPLAERSAKQEQEQEQEQESTIARKRATRTPKLPMPEDFGISDRVRSWALAKGYDRLEEHLEALKRKSAANGYTAASWDDKFMEAIREDWAKLRGRTANGAAPPPEHSDGEWHDSVKDVVAKGIELGLGGWTEPEWEAGRMPAYHVYKARVLRAAGIEPRRAA